ncbi:MAG: tRNA-dihydrouridine synthase [Candidatus Liptonbacteria bacterium]|nr:tRNA-dihydrouridine synthase [Candidatus Liptonbacteria bacterium]
MGLSVNLAGLQLEHPLMNAAGICKTLYDVRKLCRSATAAIMVGSMTMEGREVNIGNVYWTGPAFSLNSLGLPNGGAEYYREHLPAMIDIAHMEEHKPLFVSIAGFSPEEYAELAEIALNAGADGTELNLGCPNVWRDGIQKRIACFDPLLVAEILKRVEERVGKDARIFVKISPFSDPFALAEIAHVIGEAEIVKAVTAVNTFPNAFAFDESGKPRITPAGGLAGLAGPAMKPIGLGQVRQLRALLPERIQIIGVGGISDWADAQEYCRAGADAVQIGTAFLNEGPRIFGRLLTDAVDFEW